MSVFADLEIYRAVLEHMQNGIYMVDCDQKIQFWNDGAEIMTGQLRQDVVGHFRQDFFPPQKEAGKNGVCEIGGALASVLRDGRTAIAELTLRHKAGHQVTVRVRAVPIRNRIGNVIGAADIVLWLTNASKPIREAVAGYFKDPLGVSTKVRSSIGGVDENFVVNKDSMDQLKQQLEKAIREVPNFDKLKDHIEMTITNEG
jgi:PAS domain S-box-containing protein